MISCRHPYAAALGLLFALLGARTIGAEYTLAVPLPAPRIVSASEANSAWPVANLVDGNPGTEYVSAGKGTDTFVEFEFPALTWISGFRHQDRSDRSSGATLAGSELTFLDDAGRVVATLPIVHRDMGGAVVFLPIAPAILARRVRWQVTKLGAEHALSVGGAEIAFFGPGGTDSVPNRISVRMIALPIGEGTTGALQQPVKVTIDSPYLEPIDATLQIEGQTPRAIRLTAGPQTIDMPIPVSAQDRRLKVKIYDDAKNSLYLGELPVPAFRKLTIYVVPHSHVDIGYTDLQSSIEEKQVDNLFEGIEAARRTAGYPEGARFVWNLENLWPADLLLRRLNADQRDIFITAVKKGQVSLNGMYANTLTGLCRPEELVRLFRLSTQIGAETGVPIDSAMLSDVPGCTWGTVSAMAQAGIRYFSAAPNYISRVGDILSQSENKPFWWAGPSGHERVLVWVPSSGYALSALIRRLSPLWLEGYAEELTRNGYPYDVAYIRWAGQGDNGRPDLAICDFVRDWNAQHPWPHFIIGSVHDAFSALEQRDGNRLPVMHGDWTPYWEDGAGSSACETAMNRASSDRLAEAEALWAAKSPGSYPAGDFADAVRRLLLYDEHTWGAAGSIRQPDSQQTLEQWSIKHGDAATADALSRDLLSHALWLQSDGETTSAEVDVFNPNSWPRTDLATLSRSLSAVGDFVRDDQGRSVPSQRLASGELVFLVSGLPPYSSRRYTIAAGGPYAEAGASAEGATLENGLVKIALDPKTGGIVELRSTAAAGNLADPASGEELNEYLYFNGSDPSKASSNGEVAIRVGEKGPLVASLVVESTAPGCYSLTREITLVAGEDHVEMADRVDKQRLVARSYLSPAGKESVNFAFPFNVPGGQVRLEVPFGVIRPDDDQIPGSCKNWFSIDRWTDVSNADFGVTWVSLDTPLVQVGGLTANLLNTAADRSSWRKRVGPTQKLYAWVMNNHWNTNYRAYQEGPVTFRFILRPHGAYDPAEATRLAIGASQPLLTFRAHGPRPSAAPGFSIDSSDIIVTGFKPSDDGRAVILRLWDASARDVTTRIHWPAPSPSRVWLSDTSEAPLGEAGDSISIAGWGTVTLRAQFR